MDDLERPLRVWPMADLPQTTPDDELDWPIDARDDFKRPPFELADRATVAIINPFGASDILKVPQNAGLYPVRYITIATAHD